MKIVLVGNIYFSYSLLKTIFNFNSKYVIGVITNKNKKKSDYFDLTEFCKKKKIPYILTNNINSKNNFNWIKRQRPDLICCFGWSQLIRNKILNLARMGSIGYHPAQLPKNRGRHPIIWTLVLGMKFAYSTFFFMTNKADFGKVISKKKLKVYRFDNSWKLYNRLMKIASSQLIHILKKINRRSAFYKNKSKTISPSKNQNFWRKRDYNDGKIDWRMNGTSIDNLVRALDKPFPGSHFIFKNKIYKVWKIKFKKRKDLKNIEPGKVIGLNKKKPEIKCEHGSIIIKKMSPSLKLKIGDYL